MRRLIQQRRERGTLEPRSSARTDEQRTYNDANEVRIRELIKAKPDATLAEVAEALGKAAHISGDSADQGSGPEARRPRRDRRTRRPAAHDPAGGSRLAELVVTTLNDARRFKTAKQVSCYVGLVPKQYQSGQMNRLARITGQGPGLLRRVLVQVAWGLQRRPETRGHAVSERLCHGQRTRRKQAVVALARKILCWCWAILRDGSTWDDTRDRRLALT